MALSLAVTVSVSGICAAQAESRPRYAFASDAGTPSDTLQDRFCEPPGFVRTPAPQGSFNGCADNGDGSP